MTSIPNLRLTATVLDSADPRKLADFYQRLLGRGRPAKVAITACMRKLLVVLNAILRDQTPWQSA